MRLAPGRQAAGLCTLALAFALGAVTMACGPRNENGMDARPLPEGAVRVPSAPGSDGDSAIVHSAPDAPEPDEER